LPRRRTGVEVEWVLETHIHADHLSGAPLIKARTGAIRWNRFRVREVQNLFRPIFGAEDVKAEGGDFDRLFDDGDRLEVGGLVIDVIHPPGHTPACVSYKIGDAVFVGDTCSCPTMEPPGPISPAAARASSTGRSRSCCPPAGDRLFMCHDYKAPGRDQYAWETTSASTPRQQACP
jgi:glyoxylase-like metal-dependent hydrolase (beta-lactamase superfamily II)